MRKKSRITYAYDPSEEYPYTWIEPNVESSACYYKTAIEARTAANENYYNFNGSMAMREVLIVKVVDTLGNA